MKIKNVCLRKFLVAAHSEKIVAQWEKEMEAYAQASNTVVAKAKQQKN